jgi:hypothetical protein
VEKVVQWIVSGENIDRNRSRVMKRMKWLLAILVFLVIAVTGFYAASAKTGTMTCVGLYSETDAGSVSYRVGSGAWVVIKIGDVIPANAEIRINVDRDWVELVPWNNPNAVYEIDGDPDGKVILTKVPNLLKAKPTRTVEFPKVTGGKPDPKFKNKLVVSQYWGRQFYVTADGDQKDIKYGDVLERTGKVRIIATNNTITLMKDNGQVTKVIGPLNFEVEKVLTDQALYKFLNVPR